MKLLYFDSSVGCLASGVHVGGKLSYFLRAVWVHLITDLGTEVDKWLRVGGRRWILLFDNVERSYFSLDIFNEWTEGAFGLSIVNIVLKLKHNALFIFIVPYSSRFLFVSIWNFGNLFCQSINFKYNILQLSKITLLLTITLEWTQSLF